MSSSMTSSTIPRYWCHMCNRHVDPIMGIEIKCPFCDSGFIEETNPNSNFEPVANSRSVSLWAPILLGMMGPNTGSGSGANTGIGTRHSNNDDDDLDREFEDFMRRRRRRSAVRQLLHTLSEEREESETNPDRERNRELERERTSLLLNAFNQAMLLQSPNSNSNSNPNPNSNSFEDHFLGSSMNLLLQHLSENDTNRYGTPPAKKETVQTLPKVKIEDSNLNCSVCLDEFEFETEARMMPCKHKFHEKCILPWLELHSSCPVCRYQLPTDENETKYSNGGSSSSGTGQVSASGSGGNVNNNINIENVNENNNRSWPWPFNGLFSGTRSNNNNNNNGDSSSRNGGNNNVN